MDPIYATVFGYPVAPASVPQARTAYPGHVVIDPTHNHSGHDILTTCWQFHHLLCV